VYATETMIPDPPRATSNSTEPGNNSGLSANKYTSILFNVLTILSTWHLGTYRDPMELVLHMQVIYVTGKEWDGERETEREIEAVFTIERLCLL
jgi:hypothetical protein